jgi:hypothetical protein
MLEAMEELMLASERPTSSGRVPPCRRCRQVWQCQASGSQLLEQLHLGDLLLETAGAFARRNGSEPFEVCDAARLVERLQPIHPASYGSRPDHRADRFEEAALPMPTRTGYHTPKPTFVRQELVVIGQPRPGACHEPAGIEHRGGLAPEIGDEAAFGMLAQRVEAQDIDGDLLMAVNAG